MKASNLCKCQGHESQGKMGKCSVSKETKMTPKVHVIPDGIPHLKGFTGVIKETGRVSED